MGSALLICLILLAGLGYALYKTHQDLSRERNKAEGAAKGLLDAQTRIQELEADHQAALLAAEEHRKRAQTAEAEARTRREAMENAAACLGDTMVPSDPAMASAWLAEVARDLTWIAK